MVATFLPASAGWIAAAIAGEVVANVDAGAGVLLVFDFGVGERGAVVDAPVDRPQTAIDEAGLEEPVKSLQSPRFVGAGHGAVGSHPSGQKRRAGRTGWSADRRTFARTRGNGGGTPPAGISSFLATELLVDFDLDGKAVAVEARDVRGIEAGHGFTLDDEVLEALIQGMAQMERSVGVRRAVVQDPSRSAAAGLTNLLIEAGFLPALQARWLVLRQVRLHRESGAGQRQGILQCDGFGSPFGGAEDIVSPAGLAKTSLYPAAEQ